MKKLYRIRHKLYADYVKELEKIRNLPFPDSNAEKRKWCQDYLDNSYYNWIDIRDNNSEIIGFLIIGTKPDCHPDCDYFICQSYIIPENREHHFMTNTVYEFVTNHKGKYCLMILDSNEYANNFWFKLFKDLGCKPMALPIVTDMEFDETQYGFEPV